MAKPSKLPAWDTTEVNSVEPDTTHQDEGWLAPGGIPEKPPFQTFNHWMNAVWKWIKEFNRQGIVEWDGTTTYDINDVSKGSDGRIYMSLITANTNQDPTLNPTKWIDIQWRNQTVTHDMASDADYTLTATQNRYGRVVITDTNPFLTVARNIVVADEQKQFIFKNDTLQTLTVKTSAGTGIAVLAGATIWLLSDGTNVIIAADVNIATTVQAQAQTDDTTAISPLKLFEALQGANQTLATNGYQKLPGGLIIQWGEDSISSAGTTVTLPIAFPNNFASVVLVRQGATSANVAMNSKTLSTFSALTSTTGLCYWVAIGY